MNFVFAFRCLFAHQKQGDIKIDVDDLICAVE
jgi:hypothetical protein